SRCALAQDRQSASTPAPASPVAGLAPGASSGLCQLGGVHADPAPVAPELAARRQPRRSPTGQRALARDGLVWALWTQDGSATSCHQRKAFTRLHLSAGA